MRKPTLYKHRGKWRARIWDGEKYRSHALDIPVEGKKERKTEALEAALKLAEKLETIQPIKNNIGNDLLLEYIESFWREDSPYVKYKSLVEKQPLSKHYLLSNRQMIKNKIKPYPLFKTLKIKDLSKTIINDWRIWLAENGNSGKMINSAMSAMRLPLKRAYGQGLLKDYPFGGIQQAAHKYKKRGILTPVEIKKLLDTPVKDPRSRLAVYLPMYCSMRMGEVRGLLWGDIGDGVIHVCHNWQEGEGIKQCKWGSEGNVPMPRIVAELLNKLYLTVPCDKNNNTAPCNKDTDFVMSIKPYHPICREYLWRALQTELESIGITKEQMKARNIVYHSLRHTFVTAGRLAGFSNIEIMAAARHKDEKMMMRYTHAQEALDFKELGERLEKKLLTS